MVTSFYKSSLGKLIIFSTIIRIIIACSIELGNDESYYFTYALQPDWNHFDHPPMVGLFIQFFTINLLWVNDVSMRLTAIISAAICTWLIAQCGKILRNESTGFIAALLYTSSIYTSIIAGVFILPDSPQLVFWLASILVILKLLNNPENKQIKKLFLALGALIGLACMSKVHAIFIWFGFGMFILLHERKWLKNINLYLSVFISIVIISPILYWNFQNEFITWQFHSERVEIKNSGIDFDSFLTTTLGQLFYNNPINVVIGFIAVVVSFKSIQFIHKKYKTILLWLGLPIILVTTFVSLFRTTLPHWSGPGFISLIILSAAYIDWKRNEISKRYFSSWINSSIILICFIVVAGIYVINFYPGALSNKTNNETGRDDTTLDMYGWVDFKNVFEDFLKQENITEKNIIINNWYPASHILYYVAKPLQLKVIGVGNIQDLHKFVWLNKQEGVVKKHEDALFITVSNYFQDPNVLYKNHFQSIQLLKKIPQYRGGKLARYFYIYKLKNANKSLGETTL